MKRRRNPRWIAAGVLAICVGALGSLLLYSQAVSSLNVVTVTNTIMRGETIKTEDLSSTTVGHLGHIQAIPAADLAALVGQRARMDLVAGSIVVEGTVGDSDEPANHSQVGLKLEAGRLPTQQLPQGTEVQLIPLTNSAADGKQTGNSVIEATIATAPADTLDGAKSLDVWVPSTEAARVARLSAAADIAIIIKGRP